MSKFECTLTVEPVPKGRPRFGQGHVYTPEKTSQFETTVRWLLRAAASKQGLLIPVLPGKLVAVEMIFWVRDRRSDFDNYAKAISDAGNKIIWRDDRRIAEAHIYVHKITAGITPHIDLTAWEPDAEEAKTA